MSTVLFVCKANRGRSVMSQALFEQAAAGRHHAISAGSEAEPQGGPHPAVVQALRELGLDVADQQPQRLTSELAARADAVVTMGCGDACPIIPGKKQLRVDWDLPDPKDRPVGEVRATRDDIARRVQTLVDELDATLKRTA
jgi:protein-tyrosine-phosphatase